MCLGMHNTNTEKRTKRRKNAKVLPSTVSVELFNYALTETDYKEYWDEFGFDFVKPYGSKQMLEYEIYITISKDRL